MDGGPHYVLGQEQTYPIDLEKDKHLKQLVRARPVAEKFFKTYGAGVSRVRAVYRDVKERDHRSDWVTFDIGKWMTACHYVAVTHVAGVARTVIDRVESEPPFKRPRIAEIIEGGKYRVVSSGTTGPDIYSITVEETKMNQPAPPSNGFDEQTGL